MTGIGTNPKCRLRRAMSERSSLAARIRCRLPSLPRRGSNAILGDVDLMITITGDDIKTATVIKANDYPEGPLFSFKSEVHEFGLDEDGDVISVNIVADAAIEQAENRKLRK